MRLKDKVALVTGAGSGFGEGIARKFGAERARVLLVDLRGDAAEQAAGRLGGTSVAPAWQADVCSPADIKNMFDAVARLLGPLEILVNTGRVGQPVTAPRTESRMPSGSRCGPTSSTAPTTSA